jgi:glycerophosphoryl diester phosphodiesterase
MFTLRRAAVFLMMCGIGHSAFGQLIIAHRGASHDAPENTLSAFKLAIEQDADGFEADYYLTADGHIVCFHDKDTERIVGRKLLVTKTPFDELRSMDVGCWKGPQWRCEKMPTLEESLAAVPAGKKFFIELKSSVEIVEPMSKVLKSATLSPDQIVIISFHADAIAECKKQLPQFEAMWLCRFKKKRDEPPPPTVDEVAATLQRIGADGLGAEAVREYFDEAFITRLRESGHNDFGVWTVDDPEVANFYKNLGAWSITTNRPGWLRDQMKAVQSR